MDNWAGALKHCVRMGISRACLHADTYDRFRGRIGGKTTAPRFAVRNGRGVRTSLAGYYTTNKNPQTSPPIVEMTVILRVGTLHSILGKE